MTNILKPKSLKKGDTIAIVSPSSCITNFPERTNRSINFLRQRGYIVKLMPHAKKSDGYNAGTPEERASDINNAFADNAIAAILCSTGGLTANAVLPYLDYDLISCNPKIFCGYSDISTLLLIITCNTNMVTFHGPSLLPSFGEFEGTVSFTFDQFRSVCENTTAVGVLPVSTEYTMENQYWDSEDNKNLQMQLSPSIMSFGPNTTVSGPLFGGNLQTFVMLMHEKCFSNLHGKVLFLEEDGLSTEWYERYLTEIGRAGIFKQIAGLILAKPSGDYKETSPNGRTLNIILEEIANTYNLPIIVNSDCGHTKPLLTFPLGIIIEMDTTNKHLTLTEAAVC